MRGFFSFEPSFEKIFEEGFCKGSAKDEMAPRGLKDLSGEKFIRKFLHPLRSLFQFTFFDDGRFFKHSFAVPAAGAGGLIAVLRLEMLDEAVEFPVVHLDEFTDFEIEDLSQFRDLQDVDMFRLDEVFEMEWRKGALSRKGKKVEDVPIVTPIFIGLDVFEKKGRSLEPLCDLEMIIADRFVMGEVLGADPGGFEEFHRVCQFSVEAEVTRILEVAVGLLLPFP
jgi:hypothetical protein